MRENEIHIGQNYFPSNRVKRLYASYVFKLLVFKCRENTWRLYLEVPGKASREGVTEVF